MFNLFKSFFDYNQKNIDRLRKKVQEINDLEDKARVLKDDQFIKETNKLKELIKSEQKSLDDILPWSFALVREMSRRVLGQRHYDEQLIAAIALHEGKVAEQKTGEGKTLSATAPLYLNALTGKGVHLVTVNDYLARRDAGWMGQLFHNLGLTVSAIISDQSFIFDPTSVDSAITDWRLTHLKPATRKEAYQADITYGINSEFGFDYLRDNMSFSVEEMVQRGFNFAIIDEVDSVLIDEARTPHIISAAYDEDVSKYYQYAQIVRKLDPKTDYIIDEKTRTAHLTEPGVQTIEKITGVDNIYEKDFDTLFYIEAALKARTLFKIDKDYIVKDGEIIIVDEFTGRLLQGRRFSEGIHQAIEAKENVGIKRESRTLATVSLQNYFRMYKKLAGMTGTAATEAEEFNKIYKLEVVVVPTHMKMIRQDHADLIYKTEAGKWTALAETIAEEHQKGRPVLVGTTSIDKNERLSALLKKKGIPHNLLNAKNHEKQAEIIANAGKKSAVTVATNMAGRGVDIVLGGEPPSRYETGSPDKKGKKKEKDQDNKAFEKRMSEWRKKHDEVISLGGLYVIGTERHESRRIDNQLRGRSGRQGDPGETRFFVSLDDDMMRIFGGEQVSKLMTFFNIPEDQPLTHNMVTKALEQAQVKVEGFNFDIRKHLVDYDDVLNKQREIIYRVRMQNLFAGSDKKRAKEEIFRLFEEEVAGIVNAFMSVETRPDFDKMADEFALIAPIDKDKLLKKIRGLEATEVSAILLGELEKMYQKKEKEFGPELWIAVSGNIYVSTIDRYWTEHLTAIDDLREGINLRGFAQLDPLIEYKNEAFSMFEKLLADIQYEVSRRLFKVELSSGASEHKHSTRGSHVHFHPASATDAYGGATEAKEKVSKSPPSKPKQKIGRNDPCWCGSGKKYKKCHLNNKE